MGRRLLFLFLFCALTPSHSFALNDKCRFESLCERFHFIPGDIQTYVSRAGGIVRKSKYDDAHSIAALQSSELESRVLSIFENVKTRLIHEIQDESLLSSFAKRSMAARVRPLTLTIVRDRKPVTYNAEFWGDQQTILIDQSTLELPEANLINLLAHELSHSFDPDSISQSLMSSKDPKNPPLLYIPKSMAKKHLPDGKMVAEEFSEIQYFAIELILKLKGITQNQMLEGLGDYFSAKVIAKYLSELPQERRQEAAFEGIMDFMRVCVDQRFLLDNKYVPSSKIRVENIYFGNSEIAKNAGCE